MKPPTRFEIMRANRRAQRISRLRAEALDAGWDEWGSPEVEAAREGVVLQAQAPKRRGWLTSLFTFWEQR